MSEPRNLPSSVQDILEGQETEVSIHPSGQCAQARILGIAETRDKIMEAVGGGWNEAIERAAKLFEPGCSCPEPCEDYLIWPSPCATKAAQQIRSLRRHDAAPAKKLVNPEKIKCAVQRELENWFGQALDDMDDEDRIRHRLLDPIVIAVAREIKALLEGK